MKTEQEGYKEAMDNLYEWEREVSRKNSRLLKAIQSVKGKMFYDALIEVIQESDGISGLAEIVSNPIGNYQFNGGMIRGIWVDQTTNGGHTGDTFAGTVCVKIRQNKYLKFNYSM